MSEQQVVSGLPTPAQAIRHILELTLVAAVIGPLLGPVVVGWFNPIQAWGGQGTSTYAPLNVVQWGLAMLMFEAFFYVGWLIARVHRKPESGGEDWWNRQ